MEEELYINDIRIELREGSVSRTLQINDFREVKDRQSNLSKQIKIPKTDSNIRALEMVGVVGTTSLLPYQTVSVKYILGGEELITKGKGVLKNTNEFFNLVIYDGNVDLPDLLGNDKLNDLDFTAHNHSLGYASFFASFTNTTGYIYAIDGNKDIAISSTSPMFYIHTLIDMIFTQKGWTITGAILSDSDYKSRLTTMGKGFDQTLTSNIVNKYTQVNSDSHVDSYGIPTITEYSIDSYTVVDTGVLNVSFSGSVSTTFGIVSLLVRKNAVNIAIITSLTPITENFNISVVPTDVITVVASVIAEGPAPFRIDFTEAFTTKMDLDLSTYDIDFNDIIGTTRQIDFVKDVLQKFNLSYRKIRNEDEIELITSEALLTDTSGAEDWSNKFSQEINESYVSRYAIENLFKYKYDESGNDFADGTMTVSNINLKPSKTALTSIFKATALVNDRYNVPLWDIDGLVFTPIEDDLRIFKITISSITLLYRLTENEGNEISFTGSVPALDFTDLSYQTELTNNYAVFNDMLDKYIIKTINANLSVVDIYNLDFFKLKYFKQFGRYYYLNKVINFKNNKITKVELIQAPI